MKTCARCGIEKSDDEFYQHKSGARAGSLTSYCQICEKERWKTRAESRVKRSRKTLWYIDHCQACGAPVDGAALCDECWEMIPNTSWNGSICGACPFYQLCKQRVDKWYWAICEIPDTADLERVRAIYGHETAALYVQQPCAGVVAG